MQPSGLGCRISEISGRDAARPYQYLGGSSIFSMGEAPNVMNRFCFPLRSAASARAVFFGQAIDDARDGVLHPVQVEVQN